MTAKKRSTSKDVAPALDTNQAAPIGSTTSAKPAKPTKPATSSESAKTGSSAKAKQSAKSAKSAPTAKSAPRTEPAPQARPAKSVKAAPTAPKSKTNPKTGTQSNAVASTATTTDATAPIVVESAIAASDTLGVEAPAQHTAPTITVDDIRRTAYLLSQKRHGPADPVADWFEAERILQPAS